MDLQKRLIWPFIYSGASLEDTKALACELCQHEYGQITNIPVFLDTHFTSPSFSYGTLLYIMLSLGIMHAVPAGVVTLTRREELRTAPPVPFYTALSTAFTLFLWITSAAA